MQVDTQPNPQPQPWNQTSILTGLSKFSNNTQIQRPIPTQIPQFRNRDRVYYLPKPSSEIRDKPHNSRYLRLVDIGRRQTGRCRHLEVLIHTQNNHLCIATTETYSESKPHAPTSFSSSYFDDDSTSLDSQATIVAMKWERERMGEKRGK